MTDVHGFPWWYKHDEALAAVGGRACANCRWSHPAGGAYEYPYCTRSKDPRLRPEWDYLYTRNARISVREKTYACMEDAIYWEPRDAT